MSTVANNTFSYIDNNPNTNSYYQIKVVSPTPCTSTRATYGNVTSNIVDKNGNSISNLKEKNNSNFTISPNPAKQSFTVVLPSSFNSETLSIYSLSGQKVLTQKISTTKETIDVSSFSKGIYFVEIGNAREKLVIE